MVNASSKAALSPNARKERRHNILTKTFGLSAIWLVLIVMYIPILVLIAFSFTTATIGLLSAYARATVPALLKSPLCGQKE